MAYSSIVKKKCKCGCDKWPTLGWNGYFMAHAPQELKDKQTKKEVEKRNKAKLGAVSKKLRDYSKKIENRNDEAGINPQGKEKWDWFVEQRPKMQNCCIECGERTNKNNDKYFHWSICHIAPKSLVPSVALNKDNWVELCWLHHQEFDSTFEKAAAMMCFTEVKQKFQLFKHLIPADEMRKINPHLLT